MKQEKPRTTRAPEPAPAAVVDPIERMFRQAAEDSLWHVFGYAEDLWPALYALLERHFGPELAERADPDLCALRRDLMAKARERADAFGRDSLLARAARRDIARERLGEEASP